MNSDAYWHILGASISGGLIGVLVMWNRMRTQTAGKNKNRERIVLIFGTAAIVSAFINFNKVLESNSHFESVMVMILMTGWAALLHSVSQLPSINFLLKIRTVELTFLRSSWTGVRLFGKFLRNTPLRFLGGEVYISRNRRDPQIILQGIHDAESVHIWALLFCSPWLFYWGFHDRWMLIVWGLAIQFPMNIYPILHLRYANWRIEEFYAKNASH